MYQFSLFGPIIIARYGILPRRTARSISRVRSGSADHDVSLLEPEVRDQHAERAHRGVQYFSGP